MGSSSGSGGRAGMGLFRTGAMAGVVAGVGIGPGCGGVDGDGRLADESEMGETCGISEGR